MKNMYAMVFLLIVITSTSSTFCVSSNNDGDHEIFMVVDDQTTMHDIDAGIGMSKAHPVQIGKFLLEDGKVLALARKLSPSRNCVGPESDPCGAADLCCEGLYCDSLIYGRCHRKEICGALGAQCAFFDECCYPYKCSGYQRHSTCTEG